MNEDTINPYILDKKQIQKPRKGYNIQRQLWLKFLLLKCLGQFLSYNQIAKFAF